MTTAYLTAGVPAKNAILYHATRFLVGDPAALIDVPGKGRTLILREIEMDRAKQHARADAVFGYADFAPASGLLRRPRDLQRTRRCRVSPTQRDRPRGHRPLAAVHLRKPHPGRGHRP
jgi:hypothetical protein